LEEQWHDIGSLISGGSTIGLSATGAWREAVAGDDRM
jgi:hypothetical protein